MKTEVKDHFTDRAPKYNQSSSWVIDEDLIETMYTLSGADEESSVLDLATGTGLIAKRFFKNVNKVTGVDICEDMIEQAKNHVDEIHLSRIEELPFPDNSFDICICRQGLQFVDLNPAMQQIYRVLKPGGRVVLSHLTSYANESEKERAITFKILELRNPARENFFTYHAIQDKLGEVGFKNITVVDHVTRESINRWTNHGAIYEQRINQIKACYLEAPETFKRIHNVEITANDIYDDMLMVIVRAVK